MNPGARIAAVSLALASAGCISVQWLRETAHEPVPRSRVEALRPGESDLAACLAALGAPLYVWELRGEEMALAWGSYEREDVGIGFSVPLDNGRTASFDYGDIGARTEGYVLFFDAAGALREKRRGRLRDLAAGLERARPAAVEGE